MVRGWVHGKLLRTRAKENTKEDQLTSIAVFDKYSGWIAEWLEVSMLKTQDIDFIGNTKRKSFKPEKLDEL